MRCDFKGTERSDNFFPNKLRRLILKTYFDKKKSMEFMNKRTFQQFCEQLM